MNYVFGQNISKFYADKRLFSEITISINKGQKVALVAKNGTGKTSLMNIIAGLDTPDEGKMEVNQSIRIGYLKQDPEYRDEDTVLDTVFNTDQEDLLLIKRYELLSSQNDADPAELQSLMNEIDAKSLWNLESRVKQILGKLEIHNHEQLMHQLSGGQIKRVALARELILEPRLLILDEPTNHLDIQMIEWLEKYIKTHVDSLLLVTHDRYFLDNVTDEILELEGGQLHKYKGNYSYFLEKKEERLLNDGVALDKAKSLYKKELEWMRRSPSARGTKAKSRITSFYDIKDKAHQKVGEDEVQIQMNMNRLGKKVMEIQDITKSYEDKVLLKNFSYIFKRFDRIGIAGPNGCGKSTLLEMLSGIIKPDTGKIVTGSTIVTGYFRQDTGDLNPDKKVIDIIQEIAEVIRLANGKDRTAAQMLEWFQFDRKKQYQYVGTLSGGEKRRLYLLSVLMKNPNFLILDEPTNDLDLQTLNTLEDFLTEFGGVLLMVSHDRYFMDKLIDHLFVFEGDGKIRDFPGNYSQYRISLQKEKQAQQKAEKKESEKPKKEKVKTKLSYNEKREFEQLEKDLETLESRKKEIEVVLSQPSDDHEQLMTLSKELGEIIEQIDLKSDRWLELSEYV